MTSSTLIRSMTPGNCRHPATAVLAGLHIDAEDAREALRPGHGAALFFGRSIIRMGGIVARGGGTRAASLTMKSTGSNFTCVVPFFHGVLSA